MTERYGFVVAPLKIEGEPIPFDPSVVVDVPQEPDRDYLRLSTGRSLYANRGIIGIDPGGDTFGGYDGHLGADGWGPDVVLTEDERREIAEIMIARWRKFGGI